MDASHLGRQGSGVHQLRPGQADHREHRRPLWRDVEHLDAGPGQLRPAVEEGPKGQPIVTDWAAGFVDAAMLRPREWDALIRDEAMKAVFWPVLLLGAEDTEHPAFGAPPVPEDAMDALYENAEAILTECVFRIVAL